MIIYSETDKDDEKERLDERREKISDEELQFLGMRILNFVNLYSKAINTENPETMYALQELRKMSYIILNRQYDLLVNDVRYMLKPDEHRKFE